MQPPKGHEYKYFPCTYIFAFCTQESAWHRASNGLNVQDVIGNFQDVIGDRCELFFDTTQPKPSSTQEAKNILTCASRVQNKQLDFFTPIMNLK